MTIAPGDIISDRYRVVDKIGEGGMGAVFRAEHVHMRKMVALKVLLSELARHEEVVARFEREAVSAANIEHPNVATATDFGRLPDGSFFLVMEYVPGRSLRAELENGRLEPARALKITRGILGAIEAAHLKNIVHRDLKPENVMLVEREGDPDFVKVLDFGIAKTDVMTGDPAKPGLTRTGAVMGTPEYMAPEQAVGQAVDARSDLYSLGIIMYEMLAGFPPFSGEPIVVIGKQVTAPAPPLPKDVREAVPELGPILEKLLAKEPQNRFDDAKQLRAALSPPSSVPRIALDAPPAKTPPPSPSATAKTLDPAPSAPKISRKHMMIGGGALVGLIGIVAIAMAIGSGGGANAATVASASASAPASVAAVTAPPASASASASVDLDPDPEEASSAPRPKAGTATAPKKGSSKAQPRHTGPGGIYIPPPNTWFK